MPPAARSSTDDRRPSAASLATRVVVARAASRARASPERQSGLRSHHATLEPFFEEGTGAKLDKSVAVMVTKARVKADKKMELYFHTCLD
jgi:hypothetical protein